MQPVVTDVLWSVCMSVVHSLEPYPRVDCHDVLVLGTRVAISDTARDLGVVIDLRPGAVAGGPCHGRLSLWLQPATPAPTSCPIVVRECYQDTRPGVHLVSPGLLQLTAVRHQRRTTSTPAVGAERCRPPGHRRPSV